MKVLVDLKPALDGYSGIPQESRLLYSCLFDSQELRVHGLLQHGSYELDVVSEDESHAIAVGELIYRYARSVASFYRERSPKGYSAIKANFFKRLSAIRLCLDAITSKEQKLGVLDGSLFSDFIWSELLSKTLLPKDRELLVNAIFRVLPVSRKTMQMVGEETAKRGVARFLRVDTSDYDFFVSQTPFPGMVSKNTKHVVRYHDAVPIFFPHTISDKKTHLKSHYKSLEKNAADGAFFCCISRKSLDDLLKVKPELENRATVIPNIVSEAYTADIVDFEQALQILKARSSNVGNNSSSLFFSDGKFRYLLIVSTVEPRKNYQFVLDLWQRLKLKGTAGLKLVVVGNVGWSSEQIIESFRILSDRGEMLFLQGIPAFELRILYQHAALTICASREEGFGYSGVEAMNSGGVVAASNIEVHREIYRDGAIYFDMHNVEDATNVVLDALENRELLETKRYKGIEIGKCYKRDAILPMWNCLFETLKV